MRILIPANHLASRGGLERTQLTNCTGLAGRGHHLDLAFVHGGDFETAWADVSETMTRVAATLPRRNKPFRSSLGLTRAVIELRRREPDVVYVYRYLDLPLAAAIAVRRPTAVVYHLCLPPPEPVPRWLRVALSRVDATISVSRHTLGLWANSGLDTERADVALTSVDLRRYMPSDTAARSATRSELGLRPDEFVVLFAGRLTPEKGVDVLIDAFGRLAAASPRCHLVVVGSPPAGVDDISDAYVGRLKAAAADLPVSWLPHRADVLPLLQAADVAVVPSRWAEPLSRSILEPLACGVPVVATRVGGSPEILTGWLGEFLVPSEDPGALAARLGSLLTWRRDDPELGARCREAAEARLSLEDELDVIEKAMFAAVGAVRTRSARSGGESASDVR